MQRFEISSPIRAYQFLMQKLGLKMSESQSYINKGRVIYEGKPLGNCEKSKILENSVEILIFKPLPLGIKPLFENEDFALFSKPPKMLIHPKGAFPHHSLLDEIRALYGKSAHLVHRIDKETSGLVLVGKHKKSVAELGEMFLRNAIKKEYLALVNGIPYDSFCVDLPLAVQPKGKDLSVRSVIQTKEKDSNPLKFKEAKTEFETLGIVEIGEFEHKKSFALLKAIPKTGRTHQIRLHLSSLGFAILGDPLYGACDEHSREYLDSEFIEQEKENFGLETQKSLEYFGAKRLMLHAYGLQFFYKGKEYHFRSLENFNLEENLLC